MRDSRTSALAQSADLRGAHENLQMSMTCPCTGRVFSKKRNCVHRCEAFASRLVASNRNPRRYPRWVYLGPTQYT